MSDSPQTFKRAYETLRRNAERLDQDDEVDIDELVPLVQESTEAYRICKSRLDAVEKALQEALGDSTKNEQDGGAQPAVRLTSSSRPAPSFNDMDNDIPF